MFVLSTGSLYNYGLDRVFGLAEEAGYDGIEILIDGRWDSRDAAYLRRLSSNYHLPIVALHSPFVKEVQGWPPDQLGRLEYTVRFAKELNVPLVVSHLPLRLKSFTCEINLRGTRRFTVPLMWSRRDSYYTFLHDRLLRHTESSSDVIIALENMPARHFLWFSVNAYWFNHPRELIHFPHLTLDTTHLGTWGFDPLEVYRRLRHRVVHVHLSNFHGTEHRLPQDGILALDHFLQGLAENGYQGVISVEASPDALKAENERRCREVLESTLRYCRRHFIAG